MTSTTRAEQISGVAAMNEKLIILYGSLFSLLSSELAVYREMEGFLQREKKAIILSSLPVLIDHNLMKEEMVNRAAVLERSRMEVVRQIADHLHIQPEGINLSRLTSSLQVPQQERLHRFQEELKEIALRIKSLNQENQRLAESSLLYEKGWLDYFRQLLSPQKGYVSNGQMQRGSVNGKLINRRG